MKITKIEQDEYDLSNWELSIFLRYGKRNSNIAEIKTSYEIHNDIDTGMIVVDSINIEFTYYKEPYGCNFDHEVVKYFFDNIEDIKINIQNFLNK